jgi:hypothetical protein
MKNQFLSLVLLISASFLAVSCSSDDDSTDDNNSSIIVQLEASIKVGTWRVSNFVESGVNQTSHFTGYAFTFSGNGTVTATNGTNTVTGTWSTSSSSSSGAKFILNFNATSDPFEEISQDWRVESVTTILVDLKHVSGGDGSVDLLTFAKI